jgi:hypothetical protein
MHKWRPARVEQQFYSRVDSLELRGTSKVVTFHVRSHTVASYGWYLSHLDVHFNLNLEISEDKTLLHSYTSNH